MPIQKSCENCGQSFFSYPSDGRRFCGLACRSAKRFGKNNVAPGREIVDFTCKECGKAFGMMRAYLDAYLKKHKHGPLYCSRPCSNVGRAKDAEQRNTFICENCNETITCSRKPGGRIYKEQKYCSPKCKHAAFSKRALARFNRGEIGRHIKRHGYVWISVPSMVTGKRHAVMEHRYAMAKHLGRELRKDETVHHINGIRGDNRIENLELFSSRHGPGQRVIDKAQFAIEILTLYPDFCRSLGYELRKLH